MENIVIVISKDFSRTPGARFPEEGDWSGEDFRKRYLIPKLNEALQRNVKLVVDLDGTAGYGTSFLEEVFGGLIREEHYSLSVLSNVLKIKSDEDPDYIEEINEYMKAADEKERK